MAHQYDPKQPRVPAGHHGGGQWTRGDSVQVAQAQLALPAIRALPEIAHAAVAAIAAAIPLFRWLSAQNSRDKHAVIEFNAREYRGTKKRVLDLANARLLTREEVEDACDRYGDVQKITNEEAKAVRDNQPGLSPSQYGTAVHTLIAHRINGTIPSGAEGAAAKDLAVKDPNFRAEVSYLKAQEESEALKGPKEGFRDPTYGMKGTIRVDVYEKAKNETVCVYDIKTGRSGLSIPRITEIVSRVYAANRKPKRIIITEVRPQQ